MMDSNPGKISVSDATAHAACLTARDVNAAAATEFDRFLADFLPGMREGDLLLSLIHI